MQISVIIPTYNEERDIAVCLSSLQKQDHPSFEILVVDDGSTDATIDQVKKFPVKLLKQKHLGPGLARNLGAKQATGKILVFLDADMTFEPGFLRALVQPIIDSQTIGTFSTDEYVSNYDNVWAKCWNVNKNLPSSRLHPRNYPEVQPVFRAILKPEFDRVGGFDPVGYNDDWTLSQKLHAQATAAPHAVFYHRNPDSLTEVWTQASWIGKRPYKLGLVGRLITLFRTFFPIAFLIGLTKAIVYVQPEFLIFKIVFDTAIFWSVIKSFFDGFKYK